MEKPQLGISDPINGDIDDEGLHALVAGLRNCHNMTSVRLRGNRSVTEEGSRSLSAIFQSDNCRLELLDLARMNIGHDGIPAFAAGPASLPSLKRLILRNNSIGEQGLQDLVRGLVNCNIEELDLSDNMLTESVSGMRALGTLARRTTSMCSLNLCDTSLTDEGLQSFAEGIANCGMKQRCNLKELDLSHNRSITANGLASLSLLFRAEHSTLCAIDLHGMNICDDGAAALANGLVGNKSLTTLEIDIGTVRYRDYSSVSNITARGWAAFSRLLCDNSSVNNTYLSNHTLVHIGICLE